MTTVHLTDQEVQQYILDNTACDTRVIEHVSTCKECKTKVADYQLLFTGIKQMPAPSFDFDLAELVLAKLPSPQPALLSDNFFVYLLTGVLILLTGVLLYIFRGYVVSLFEGISTAAIYLIITTGIVMLSALGLDMYKSYQKKINVLDFY